MSSVPTVDARLSQTATALDSSSRVHNTLHANSNISDYQSLDLIECSVILQLEGLYPLACPWLSTNMIRTMM